MFSNQSSLYKVNWNKNLKFLIAKLFIKICPFSKGFGGGIKKLMLLYCKKFSQTWQNVSLIKNCNVLQKNYEGYVMTPESLCRRRKAGRTCKCNKIPMKQRGVAKWLATCAPKLNDLGSSPVTSYVQRCELSAVVAQLMSKCL